MAKRRNNAQRLRNSVERLPDRTKEAMLRGIRANRVIVGAYVDKRGGVCPMLAAHRNGGRTNFGTFARAWDAFTGANQRKPRRASRREVRALEGYLEMALLRDGIHGTEPIPERPLARGGPRRQGHPPPPRAARRRRRPRTGPVEDVSPPPTPSTPRPGRPRPGLRRGLVRRAHPAEAEIERSTPSRGQG